MCVCQLSMRETGIKETGQVESRIREKVAMLEICRVENKLESFSLINCLKIGIFLLTIC